MIIDISGAPAPTRDEVTAALDQAREGSDDLDIMIAIYLDADVAPPARYTRSIDSALLVLPDGWSWTLRSNGGGKVFRGRTVVEFAGPTPALGICRVAMKVRPAIRAEAGEEKGT